MKLYPGAGCRLRAAEIYPDASEALKQLERHTIIVSPEQPFKLFLINTREIHWSRLLSDARSYKNKVTR